MTERVATRVLEPARKLKNRLGRRRYRARYADLSPVGYTSAAFRAEARRAAEVYGQLVARIGTDRISRFDAAYSHPVWARGKADFGRSLSRGIPENFLDHPVLRLQMVRRGWGGLQEHERRYLLSRPAELQTLLRRFTESRVGEPFLECSSYPCSATSLGHLYYAARILEAVPRLRGEAHTVVEFGGGYGNFARIYGQVVPTAAHVIVDFPEFLALQMVFLRSNGVDAVISDADQTSAVEPGSVALVPVYLLPEVGVRGTLFVSHFGLSETPRALQELVAERRFLGCEALYLTGQYTGRQPAADWSPHEPLQQEIRECYDEVHIADFPVPWAYEVTATSVRDHRPGNVDLAGQ